MEKIQTVLRCSSLGMRSSNINLLRLDFCLLPDRMLGEELIGGRKCRVVMDTRVPLE